MHDPKFMPGLATAFKLDATPGKHMQGNAGMVENSPESLAVLGVTPPAGGKYDYVGQGEMYRTFAMICHTVNVLGLCAFQFGSVDHRYIEDFMQAVTGWDDTLADYVTAGERVAQIRHAFNLREGILPMKVEVHPRMIGQPPLAAGPNAGITIDLDTLGKDFAIAMGWDPDTGMPAPERLEALGLPEVAAALAR